MKAITNLFGDRIVLFDIVGSHSEKLDGKSKSNMQEAMLTKNIIDVLNNVSGATKLEFMKHMHNSIGIVSPYKA